jgi:hypothetical protein
MDDFLSSPDFTDPDDLPFDSPPRRRGAQPGNTNAVKLGFYSRRFKKRDLAGLDATDPANLEEEIAIFRLQIRRVIELGQSNDDPYFALAMLRALSVATHSLSRMVRVQNAIHPPGSGVSDALSEAMADVIEELNLKNWGK